MPNPDFIPKCACCDKLESDLVGDWYIIGGGGPVETWEFYCTKACFDNHEDRTCGCFEELLDEPEDEISF